ncbi:MAG: hypothetical protein WCH62_05720 [Candidatus Omnitrophota bacterium]
MNNKGQSVIEYILLAVAVILVLLVIVNPHSGPIKDYVNTVINSIPEQIGNITSNIHFQ